MKRSQRITTIEREHPDQWVVIDVTRLSRDNRSLSGRVLAHAPDRETITREAVRIGRERPEAHLFTFYTGELIPHGMILVLAGI